MSGYTGAGAETLALAVLLSIIGAVDVWRHVWRSPKNEAPVNTGESPATPTRSPR